MARRASDQSRFTSITFVPRSPSWMLNFTGRNFSITVMFVGTWASGKFAEAADTPWCGNFRDLNAAITRMATLAPRGRIRVEEVEEEIERLRESWKRPGSTMDAVDCVSLEGLLEEEIDPFDRIQLTHVVSVCRRSRTLSEAGRELFSISRKKRSVTNDADRLKKYLAKFGLDFERCRQ